jgi:WD40 repeat protein
MFRWTALCLVLCAGAFALVAMATGAFNPHVLPTGDTVAPTAPASEETNDTVQPPPSNGLGRGGALILHDARLTAFEREEVPCQRDGAMLIVGTDAPDAPGEALAAIPVPFLAREIDAKDPNAPPEDQWYVLNKATGFRFPEALNQALVKADWPKWKAVPNQKFYVRWKEGDPLLPKQVQVVFERRVFHKLSEGDWVKKDQLVALVDPTVQVNDVSSKVAKMETAESDWLAAIKTKEEAIRRAQASELLWSKGKGFISEDNYRADLLNRDRYIEEEKGKDAARKVANEDLAASLSILKQHHIEASISGNIKVIYKHPGESVKNLDPIMQIQNPEKLRVEGLADWQDAQILATGMRVVIEPTRPTPPVAILSGHQQEVTCVAVSPTLKNGKKLILSGSEDGEVRFWDSDLTAKEPQVARLDHHTGVLAVVCTGPKSARHLALTGDRNGVGRIIDLDRLLPAPAAAIGATAKEVQAMPVKLSETHKGPITCAAFSPDGAYCATGGEDRAIRLWNTADGKLIQTLFAAHKAAVTSVQFAQEKGKVLQLVSAGGDNTLHVWNLEKVDAPTPTPTLTHRSGDVTHLGVSSDGKYVLFDHGSEVRVLSLADRQIEGVIQSSSAATNFTTMALFSPDGNSVLTNSASEGRLQLWRTPGRLALDGQDRAAELRQFVRVGGGTATCAAFDPDEKQPAFVVTGSRDNSVMVWPMPKTTEILAKPRETTLTLVERSLDNGSRQVRVWAEIDNPDWKKPTGLTPGGTATMVIPPTAPVAEAK